MNRGLVASMGYKGTSRQLIKILNYKYHKETGLSKNHIKVLNRWYESMSADGNKLDTITTNLRVIKLFFSYIKKDVIKIETRDLIKYFKYLTTKPKETRGIIGEHKLTPCAVTNYKIKVLNFFKWYIGQLPKETKEKYDKFKPDWSTEQTKGKPFLYSTIKKGKLSTLEKINPDDVLNSTHIKKMCAIASDYEACLISLLFETGARANEISQIKIKDVEMRTSEAIIKVRNSKRKFETKKTYRNLLVIDSFYYLRNLLRFHRFKDDPEAPLFWHRKRFKTPTPLGRSGMSFIIRRIGKEAEIKKPLNLHWFRHSSATRLASVFSDAELREQLGHIPGSKMIGRYTHKTEDSRLNKQRQESKGKDYIDPEIEKAKPKLKLCPNCNTEHDLNKHSFCGLCGCPLDGIKSKKLFREQEGRYDKVIVKLDKLIKRDEILNNIFRDPAFEKIAEKHGLGKP